MKNLIWYGAMAAVVTVAATASGQSQIHQTSSSSSSYIVTRKLIGRKVKSSEGEKIGVIKEVVIDRTNGCMAYTVVSTGSEGTGVASGDGKLAVVQWTVYSLTTDLRIFRV